MDNFNLYFYLKFMEQSNQKQLEKIFHCKFK